MKALIIGLGLIGGSLAKSLKKNSDWIVAGYDINEESLTDAVKQGAIDSIWSSDTQSDADLTVLCLSPENCVGFLKSKAPLLRSESVVTDVCGVKKWIVEQCEPICRDYGLHFIGGHPMAGREHNGFKNSDENLFNRASYILTPVDSTSKKALDTAKMFVEAVNAAKITVTTPYNHDRVIAFTSQIPHILAGAYVKSPSCKDRHGFSAGSFKDVSRVATIDENLWSELFVLNKEPLLHELDHLISSLYDYKTYLENNNIDGLKNSIRQGRIIKENDIKDTEWEEKSVDNA